MLRMQFATLVCVIMAVLICHNNSIADPIQITIGSEHIEDTWLNNAVGHQNDNNGMHGGAIAGFAPVGGSVFLIRLLDLQQLIGERRYITSCSLYVFISNADGNSGDKTVGVMRVFKPWVAGAHDYCSMIESNGAGATYNCWDSDRQLAWTIAGCHYEDDAGKENDYNGVGADCKATPEDTVQIGQTSAYPWVEPGYHVWEISPELVNDWYRGSIQNNGLVMKVIEPWGWVHPWQANYWVEEMKPYFVVEYESALDISLSPITSPMVIPATGGVVEFALNLTNITNYPETFDVWALVENFSQGGMMTLSAREKSLSPQESLQANVGISIPGRAPSGSYLITVFVGDFPDYFCNSDALAFEKSAGDGSRPGNGLGDWHCSSDLFDTIGIDVPGIPISPKLVVNAYPNPFNPTAAISIQLSAFSYINLSVYDISGRKVSTLIDGWRDAGSHEITFDGSGLSSGLYFYHIEAGGFSAVGKMVLMK